jgi:hypothetical protein
MATVIRMRESGRTGSEVGVGVRCLQQGTCTMACGTRTNAKAMDCARMRTAMCMKENGTRLKL